MYFLKYTNHFKNKYNCLDYNVYKVQCRNPKYSWNLKTTICCLEIRLISKVALASLVDR